jgi:hypothetical protein
MKVCRICKTELTSNNTHNYKVKKYNICRGCENQRSKNKDEQCKIETLAAYGNKCICCGEAASIFLTIDHINDNGAEERRQLNNPGGHRFYRLLKKQGYPKDNYQILCFNCNHAKHVLGKCPHPPNNYK